jgi:hypothetical protein
MKDDACDKLEPAIRAICRGEDPRISLRDVNLNRANGFAGRIAPLPPLDALPTAGLHAPPPPGPSLLIRGWNFAAAMARWTLAGMPRRTQAEIDERLAICQACPYLQNDHCEKCGCACVEQNRLMNKLTLATERCPDGKWT